MVRGKKMNIIVQKFGGTSITTKELREVVAKKAIQAKLNGEFPVMVVSAIGRKGDPYATDTLIQFANTTCKEYQSRELDLIMSCGEIISSVMVANTIKTLGYKSMALTGFQAGIITNNCFGNAEVVKVEHEKILNILKEGIIPVITGFQGISENNDITTLGRGGSDTTAAILGEALKAEVVEIYTDVEGVMTADPRIVREAKVISKMCYDEVYQMAEEGAKVVHPRAVAVARRSNIPLKVKSIYSDAAGTIITSQLSDYEFSYSHVDEDVITAIAHKNNISQITVTFDESNEYSELLMNLLTKNNISIDMINFFVGEKIFTIDSVNIEKLESLFKEHKLNYKCIDQCSKITAIGHKMRGVPGIMARIVKALSKHNIQILQTSDSYSTISCLIKDIDLDIAINALHNEFGLNK